MPQLSTEPRPLAQGAIEKQKDPKITKRKHAPKYRSGLLLRHVCMLTRASLPLVCALPVAHFALGRDSAKARVLALEHTITHSRTARAKAKKS